MVVMVKDLIALMGICMVVGMPLKLEQKEIADHMACIPRVQMCHFFIPSIYFLSNHPIMLNVIHQFQQTESEETLGKKDGQGARCGAPQTL